MADATDMQVHRKTYDKVIGMFKYGGIAVAIVALVIIYLISGR